MDEKKQYAENVWLSLKQYHELIGRYGRKQTDEIIEYFSLCKCSKGYKYASDYHAILKWAVDAYREKTMRQNNYTPDNSRRPERAIIRQLRIA